jgi:uncharacterized protein YkwD
MVPGTNFSFDEMCWSFLAIAAGKAVPGTIYLCLAPFLALAAPPRPNIETVESLVIQGTNEFRAGENLSRVERNAKLDKAARSFAEHLASGGAFSHESGGTTPEIRVFQAGYQACVVAENLARHYSSAGFSTKELADKLVQGWKDSPGHRRNMLERDALETGLAVIHRSHDGIEDFYAVQLLATKESATVHFRIRNRSEFQVSYRVNGKEFTLNQNYIRAHGRCAKPDILFEGRAHGRFAPADGECLVVPANGEVKREPAGCE